MSLSVNSQPPRRSLKSFLFPMFLLSVGAHALVLMFVPMPGQQVEEDPIVQPLPEETETISVVRLPKPLEPEVDPTPNAESNPKPAQPSEARPTPTQAATPRPTTTATQPEATANTESIPDDQNTGDGTSEDNPNGTDEDTGGGEPTLEEKLADASYYEYNVSGTSRDDVNSYTMNWSLGLAQQGLSFIKSDPEDLTIPYRLPNCLATAPSEYAAMGVIVDGAGSIAGEPEILGSTGYSNLDQFALEKVRTDFPFPATGETKAYIVGIEVEGYEEKCVN